MSITARWHYYNVDIVTEVFSLWIPLIINYRLYFSELKLMLIIIVARCQWLLSYTRYCFMWYSPSFRAHIRRFTMHRSWGPEKTLYSCWPIPCSIRSTEALIPSVLLLAFLCTSILHANFRSWSKIRMPKCTQTYPSSPYL